LSSADRLSSIPLPPLTKIHWGGFAANRLLSALIIASNDTLTSLTFSPSHLDSELITTLSTLSLNRLRSLRVLGPTNISSPFPLLDDVIANLIHLESLVLTKEHLTKFTCLLSLPKLRYFTLYDFSAEALINLASILSKLELTTLTLGGSPANFTGHPIVTLVLKRLSKDAKVELIWTMA
jgi:hypothetical protein